MIRILCYGDSNTWGTIPPSWNERYDETIRWPKKLESLLGDGFTVIEEGFRGRNIGHDDINPLRGNRNGSLYFSQCVLSHEPLDYVIIMLGTNDMKAEINATTKECAKILKDKYIKHLRNDLAIDLIKVPKIVIVAPCIIEEVIEKFKGTKNKSLTFYEDYKEVAEKHNCLFVSNENLKAGCDGLHFTKESHLNLANSLCKLIKKDIKERL